MKFAVIILSILLGISAVFIAACVFALNIASDFIGSWFNREKK